MQGTIINLIENESENTKLDFKLEQYPIEKGNNKKGEFLKDMCALEIPVKLTTLNRSKLTT